MTVSSDRLRGGSVKRLRRVRALLGHYGAIAEESGNPELIALVHDLDDVLTARGGAGCVRGASDYRRL